MNHIVTCRNEAKQSNIKILSSKWEKKGWFILLIPKGLAKPTFFDRLLTHPCLLISNRRVCNNKPKLNNTEQCLYQATNEYKIRHLSSFAKYPVSYNLVLNYNQKIIFLAKFEWFMESYYKWTLNLITLEQWHGRKIPFCWANTFSGNPVCQRVHPGRKSNMACV